MEIQLFAQKMYMSTYSVLGTFLGYGVIAVTNIDKITYFVELRFYWAERKNINEISKMEISILLKMYQGRVIRNAI